MGYNYEYIYIDVCNKNDEKRGCAFESEQGGECVRAWREVREAKINKIENYSSNFRIMILHYCTYCF